MKPTEDLKHEHEVILLVLTRLEPAEETPQVDAAWLEQFVDLSRVFIDRCHHGKEERLLIPRMHERGISADDRAIYFTLREHEQGRALVRAIAEALPGAQAGQAEALAAARDSLQQYGHLLQGHIRKEHEVLFPMADGVFTAADQVELEAAFEKLEAEEIGAGVHEKYHHLAHELAGRDEEG